MKEIFRVCKNRIKRQKEILRGENKNFQLKINLRIS